MSRPLIIFIVDDDEIYKYTMTKTIERQKIAKKILTFSDGEEAINFMIDNVGNSIDLPDIIFLDINMPIMDGFQFMEEYVLLKPRIGKKIVIYMVTSSVDPIDIDRAKKISEISNYIVKPIKADKLSEIMAAIPN
jgi:CheY-like chemotaxis protein